MKKLIAIIFFLILGLSSQAQLGVSNTQLAVDFLSQSNLSSAKEALIKSGNEVKSNSKDELFYLKTRADYEIEIGDFSSAIITLTSAKTLAQKLNKDSDIVSCLDRMGIVYWKTGNIESAMHFLEEAATRNDDLVNPGYEADNFNNRGLILSETNPEKALMYYEMAISYYKAIKNKEVENQIVLTQNNIAIAKRNLGHYFEAIEVFEEVEKHWTEMYGEQSQKLAFVEANIGQTYYLLKDYNMALDYYNRALAKYKIKYGEHHPELASIYNYLSNVYLSKLEFKKALEINHQAREANCKANSNLTNLQNYYDKQLLVAILEENAEILIQKYYRKSLSPKDLKTALSLLDTCTIVLEEQRRLLITKQDKIALGVISNQVNEMAIECILLLREEFLVSKKVYDNKLFEYIERSKGSVLLDAVQDAQARQFGGIPDELIAKEREIMAALSLLETQLSAVSPQNEIILRENITSLRNEYKTFVRSLELNYPKYYELKYQTSNTSLSTLQIELEDEELLLNYFMSKKTNELILLIASNKRVDVYRKEVNKKFDKWLLGYMNSIKFSNFGVFTHTSEQLYKALMLDKISSRFSHLIIIPHSSLGAIPFESIIPEKSKQSVNFSSLDYLINDFAFSYHFSANLWLEEKNKTQIESKQTVFYAPVNFQEHHISSLFSSITEVLSLDSMYSSKSFKTEVKTYQNATETSFQQSASSGNVLWLSTHGSVNVEQPDRSCIYLVSDDSNDGVLYSGEIYGLELNYNLIALSACETGLGKESAGEGVIGLSRALIFAGAKNVLVSYWSVNDQSTTDLMLDFNFNKLNFLNEFENHTFADAKALQIAKKEMIKKDGFTNPYYWAPFILIGR